MTTEHTPTPWKIIDASQLSAPVIVSEAHKARIANLPDSKLPHMPGVETNKANAAFIVRAVNAHDALVEALSDVLEQPHILNLIKYPVLCRARAALRLAKGSQS